MADFKICISVPLIFEPIDNIYYQMIIQETLLWFILDKYLGIFLSLAVVFISSHNLFHRRFFQYLNSFRFEEFPSVLWSIAYLNDNKQITFNYFFRILLTKSRTSLKFVTNKLFLLNTSDKIKSLNGIAWRSKFKVLVLLRYIIAIRYNLPYNSTFDSFCDREN